MDGHVRAGQPQLLQDSQTARVLGMRADREPCAVGAPSSYRARGWTASAQNQKRITSAMRRCSSLADVPVDGRRVVVSVRVRRLVCPTRGCRHTFREEVPGVLDRYQRRTIRLTRQVKAVVEELLTLLA